MRLRLAGGGCHRPAEKARRSAEETVPGAAYSRDSGGNRTATVTKQRGGYFVLNALFIFCMAMGANDVAGNATATPAQES